MNFNVLHYTKKSLENIQTCFRCNLIVPENEVECPHCKGLNEQQAIALGMQRQNEMEEQNSGLASNFRVIFIILALLMIVGLTI